jgi:hypothetical protein
MVEDVESQASLLVLVGEAPLQVVVVGSRQMARVVEEVELAPLPPEDQSRQYEKLMQLYFC